MQRPGLQRVASHPAGLVSTGGPRMSSDTRSKWPPAELSRTSLVVAPLTGRLVGVCWRGDGGVEDRDRGLRGAGPPPRAAPRRIGRGAAARGLRPGGGVARRRGGAVRDRSPVRRPHRHAGRRAARRGGGERAAGAQLSGGSGVPESGRRYPGGETAGAARSGDPAPAGRRRTERGALHGGVQSPLQPGSSSRRAAASPSAGRWLLWWASSTRTWSRSRRKASSRTWCWIGSSTRRRFTRSTACARWPGRRCATCTPCPVAPCRAAATHSARSSNSRTAAWPI